MMDRLKRTWTLWAAIAFAVAIALTLGAQGCATPGGEQETGNPISIEQDPAVLAIAIEEGAYGFAYYMLRDQSENTILRVEAGMAGVEDVLDGGDVKMALDSAIVLVQTYGFLDEEYIVLSRIAARLLGRLLQVNIDAPAGREIVIDGIRAFLAGTRAGIADARG